ncbi:MAG: DUF3035 domain-containing protein [Alphaproteobacteria bacterium]|jgi:hypothetical protein|nr:DUF3035 domain-containing protein [Alphaproteobacteria bacterium]
MTQTTVSTWLRMAPLIAVIGLSGCQSLSNALGYGKTSPDEFRVVSKAPLVLPPDYSLRPPAPGEPRPQELQPESAAREALLGERDKQVRDDAEKALVAKAGANQADPLVRYVIDDEFGSIAHKDKSFADWVMFWRKGEAPVPTMQTAANTPAPVDAAVEQKRISGLTGDKPIIIARKGPNKLKLPGL